MRIGFGLLFSLVALAGCATTPARRQAAEPVQVTLIGFNDFHGNLLPPRQSVPTPRPGEGAVRVPAGGAAYLASAIDAIRATNPNHLVLSAGDLVSASPLVSALFLDEPTIQAMNLIRLDFNAVGNHEFDRGRAELLRLDRGGCEKNTAREPCALDPAFAGADFGFLAANVVTETGDTLFPAYAIRRFGSGAGAVDVAVIGMTLEGTPTVVTPEGVAGLAFRDEADTVNALVPRLRAEGADAIVVVVHEGVVTKGGYNDKSCEGLSGDLMDVLRRLSPEVDVVMSGHTHNAYICDFAELDPQRPFLLTSAGQYGTMVTEIRLTVDPVAGVVSRSADNRIVQGEAYRGSGGEVPLVDSVPRYAAEPRVAELVERYRAAAEPRAMRVVGSMRPIVTLEGGLSHRQVLGQLVADAQLAATRASGAEIAFMNPAGVRADIAPSPEGSVTFGQIFASQPFGNTLVVRSFTGRQIKALLEQQWASGSNSVERPMVLLPSAGFTYSYDLSRPQGQRVLDVRLNGEPLQDERSYRVTMNSFLSSGGDNFTVFREGTGQAGGPQDLDALEAYFAANANIVPPVEPRARNVTRR